MGTSVNQSAATAPPRNHRTSHLSRRGINIATFDRLADAEELREILERRGIVSWVQDERRLQRYWFIAHPQAGIHVRVPESLTELAQEELDSNPAAVGILQCAVSCPFCHSYRVEYPAMTRKNVLPTLIAQLAVVFGLIKHECYCESCHYTWVRATRLDRGKRTRTR